MVGGASLVAVTRSDILKGANAPGAPFAPFSSLSTKSAAMWNNDNAGYPGNNNAPYPPPGGYGAAPVCVVVSFVTNFRNGCS